LTPRNDMPENVSSIELAPAKVESKTEAIKQEQFFTNLIPGLDTPLPDAAKSLARAVLAYEKALGYPLFLILNADDDRSEYGTITPELAELIIQNRDSIAKSSKVGLVLHTRGGDPSAGYKIATFFQKHCGEIEIIVPKFAKSTGTLMALAAKKVLMGDMAELGPLDMQIKDPQSEIWDSALNETQCLQTLGKEALVLYMDRMNLLKRMIGNKNFETRNRIATDFAHNMIHPLVEKIDAVHYTKMARIMEIMKEYGRQLMKRANIPESKARRILDALCNDFPDHGYVLDAQEAAELGLPIYEAEPKHREHLAVIEKYCGVYTIVGRIRS
jgi:hypothetical protein